ncbi:hypothetical protein [Dyella choica]|uniref:Uncharacterized protein n=1 Tax=Dyella choica TaxID=1927959 RepID=A0A3S0WVY0_9GAMM|nr:hypothetical protein [Dyella choica]RUL75904.1 hypothetical protein EKH80_09250 [Dyella choica]
MTTFDGLGLMRDGADDAIRIRRNLLVHTTAVSCGQLFHDSVPGSSSPGRRSRYLAGQLDALPKSLDALQLRHFIRRDLKQVATTLVEEIIETQHVC